LIKNNIKIVSSLKTPSFIKSKDRKTYQNTLTQPARPVHQMLSPPTSPGEILASRHNHILAGQLMVHQPAAQGVINIGFLHELFKKLSDINVYATD